MENYGSISPVVPKNMTVLRSLIVIFTASRINCFLIFILLGYLAHELKWNDTWVFILNFLAMIPFAKLFEFAIEDISSQVDKKLGSLLRVIFGNSVELIFFMVALKAGKLQIIHSLILGSIILNLLLVSGMRFDTKTIRKFKELSFIDLACSSLIIPVAFNFVVGSIDDQFLKLSHVMATVLLIFGILYHYYQVTWFEKADELHHREKRPQLSIVVLLFLLAALIVVATFTAEYLIGSIEGSGLSKPFMRILLPIICDAELVTAISKIFSTAGISMKTIIFGTAVIVFGWQLKSYFQPIYISCLIAGHLIQRNKLQKIKKRILHPDSLPY
uniref:Sodium/calcium exchanger membrane region domain-containing protein n=1 Tax=Rhizophagus irregularis (strain DAOM 181602 / DAOM 197198 / MUCL 43194) TaxID=747089 RepID=U9SRR2_RHIID